MSQHVTAGDVGGVFAGLVAILYALGKGAAWVLNWKEARENTRSAKLDAWHRELAEREAKLDAEIETRLNRVEQDHATLVKNHTEVLIRFERSRAGYRVIAAELISLAPHSAALIQATAILKEALPIPTDLSPEMAAEIQKLSEID